LNPTTLIPTLNPTTLIPTLNPTTSYPTISTISVNALTSNKSETGNKTNSTDIIIATCVGSTVILVVIAFLCFGKKKDPYQIWTNFYETKQNRMSENITTDIHHFYNKPSPPAKQLLDKRVSSRLSIHPHSAL
jgi:hypothetical protein